MTTIRYFTDSRWATTSLFRQRSGHFDEVFVRGAWKRTNAILDWMVGENDFLEQISEAKARASFPAAFA